MNITFDKGKKDYILGNKRFSKSDFISYIRDDLLETALLDDEVKIDVTNDHNNKDEVAERRDNFIFYLNTKGASLNPSYSNALENEFIINKLKEKYGFDYNSFYYVSDPNVIEKYIDNCNSLENEDEEFKNHYVVNHRTLKSALKKYEEFLDSYYVNKKNLTDGCKSGDGKNLVIYGTPGCGKSYILDKILKNLGDININELKYKGLGLTEDRIIRTTFHHDYSNTDFIGQIVPQVDSDGSATYVINPGPFTKALTKAFQSNEPVALVIEELNRGDAAGILGDIFQLLDRYKETDENKKQYKGVSQYPIENSLIQTYLNEHTDYVFDNIRIPSNLYIFATMNTSDQNVFTLDTAFKRRWDFIKMRNYYDGYDKNLYVPGSDMTWINFVKKLNIKMLRINGQINEDKQLGLYFVEKELLVKENEEFSEEKIKKFAFKVLEYLWDDVVRYDRTELFDNKIETLDDLVAKYVDYAKNNESLKVFNNDVFSVNS